MNTDTLSPQIDPALDFHLKIKAVSDLHSDSQINTALRLGYKAVCTVPDAENGVIVTRVAWVENGDPPRIP